MSVLVSDRTESKFEAITYSVELHDMLIELMQRSFGVKDLDRLVRMKYAYGKDTTEDFSRYRYLMLNYKNRIDQLASMLTSNIRAANSIYPTTLHEYEQRRDYQNTAIVNCEQLLKELQRIVEIFEVHLRKYYRLYGNESWILFGDFSKFYDNIIHEIAKRELLRLFDDDEFIDWLLTQIFDGFKIDVSYMTDEEYATCMTGIS